MTIRIDRIVTRTGDAGLTSLPASGRVPKTDRRIQAAGALDELNSIVGYVLATHEFPRELREVLCRVQHWLFDAGAALASASPSDRSGAVARHGAGQAAVAGSARSAEKTAPQSADRSASAADERTSEGTAERLWEERTAALEHAIARGLEQLNPLDGFVIPGGRPEAAALHWVRAVARRTEIALWAATDVAPLPTALLRWTNRLSDALFVWARLCNDGGRGDVLWRADKRGAAPASNDV